jgi:hypothetical protein
MLNTNGNRDDKKLNTLLLIKIISYFGDISNLNGILHAFPNRFPTPDLQRRKRDNHTKPSLKTYSERGENVVGKNLPTLPFYIGTIKPGAKT